MEGDETDTNDEAWVTYSGFLTDDELFRSLDYFREGVRVLLVSDSCHSGTMNRQFAASRSGITLPRGGAQDTPWRTGGPFAARILNRR